jgi:hypothetical protein
MTPNTIIHRRLTITILFVLSASAGISPFAWSESIEATVSRPFSGACQTRFQVLSPPNTFPVQLHIDTECNFAHLGLTVGSTSQTVVPPGPPVGQTLPVLISNSTTYRAANGDQLYAVFVGGGTIDLVTGDVTFSGKETFNGGTGRFADASGSDSLEGSASTVANTGEFTVRGTLTY